MNTPTRLISPYGGKLSNLIASAEECGELTRQAQGLPWIQLSARSQCDLELLSTGAFSPLRGFMGRQDYLRVLHEMRLSDGTFFPIPVTLPVSETDRVEAGRDIALRNTTNHLIAVMRVEEIYEWDPELEARLVFGTTDEKHPIVAEMASWGRCYIAGPLKVFPPQHDEFPELWRSPAEVRRMLEQLGYSNVVGLHTNKIIHRSQEELTKQVAARVGGSVLLHPVVGMANAAEIDHYTRVRSYKVLAERYFDPARTVLSLLPLATRLAGPREILWQALIERNYGVTHVISDTNLADAGTDSQGQPFYREEDVPLLIEQFGGEIEVTILPAEELAYLPDEDRYEQLNGVSKDSRAVFLSSGEAHAKYLMHGRPVPAWFTRPEVAAILTNRFPPRYRQGFCIWFTGLPSAGKSTVAVSLSMLLREFGRQVTVLDGDVVRTHLSKGLGFSKEDRDTNILRIGFVASEIVRHGGATICAAVSPYRATRSQVRNLIGNDYFIEVFINTPIEICESRDVKGFYAKAKAGEIKGFTGVDDPYEPPASPELVLTTTQVSAQQNARKIVEYLLQRNFLIDDLHLASHILRENFELAVK